MATKTFTFQNLDGYVTLQDVETVTEDAILTADSTGLLTSSGVLVDASDNITGINDLTIGGTFTDGTMSISGGDLTVVGTIGASGDADLLTLTSGVLTVAGTMSATTITDGTATLTGGNLTVIGTIGSSGDC